MAYTGFARYQTGATLYAQTRPGDAVVDWPGSAIAGTEDAVIAGQYEFPGLDEGSSYEVYVQAGGTPATTDLAVWEFPEALSSGGGTGTLALEIETLDTDTQLPVQNVLVEVVDTDLSGMTNTLGKLQFNVSSGTYTLRVTPPAGYRTPFDEEVPVTGDTLHQIFLQAISGAVSMPEWMG